MSADDSPAHGPVDVEVDAIGLRCPLPVLRLAAALRQASPGTLARVLATDPAVQHDVPAWAQMRGHELVAVREVSAGRWEAVVRTGPLSRTRA